MIDDFMFFIMELYFLGLSISKHCHCFRVLNYNILRQRNKEETRMKEELDLCEGQMLI